MTQRTQREFAGVQTDPSQIDPRKTDRRRVARYSCSGQAQIACLPLNGALLRGSLRDLGLGGCRIESIEATSPFDLRARTEILVKVNSWFFRAMAHVRAVRGQSAISVEFMRMSAGGYSTLAELIADLKRPRQGVIRTRRPLSVPIRSHPP
jgi:c-di-GMP-binding flagellar brake protein YcgR